MRLLYNIVQSFRLYCFPGFLNQGFSFGALNYVFCFFNLQVYVFNLQIHALSIRVFKNIYIYIIYIFLITPQYVNNC